MSARLPDMPLPTCAVCNRPVDQMYQTVNVLTDTVTFAVHCHGEIESVNIETTTLARAQSIGMGRAFERLLPDADKPLLVELNECFKREQHKLIYEDLCARLAEWEAKR